MLLFASILCFTGCGEAHRYRYASVSGQVTLDGKPIQQGRIAFFPGEPGRGAGGNAPIVDGVYQLTEVPLGRIAFTFSASVDTGKYIEGPGGNKEPERINPVPERYRTEGVLRDISGGNPQDFELTTK